MSEAFSHSLKRLSPGVNRLATVLVCSLLFVAGPYTRAQSASGGNAATALPNAPQPQNQDAVTLRTLPINIVRDQATIWSSPAKVRIHDLVWLLPLSAATGVAIATDHHTMDSVVSHDPGLNHAADTASNALVGTLIGTPVVLYGYGLSQQNAHAQETGLLSAEALGDAVVVEQGMKLIFWRERPGMDHARGLFFQSSTGADSSFPSSHSVVAWSAAAVLAEEYPSRWMRLGVYSLATGVSLNRVLAQEHFPADVLVGSAAGWLVGRMVYQAHHRHDRDLHSSRHPFHR